MIDPPPAIVEQSSAICGTTTTAWSTETRAALSSAILLEDATAGYTTAKDVTSPSRAAKLCKEATVDAMVLTLRGAVLFPRRG